jgi:hypothetical protein
MTQPMVYLWRMVGFLAAVAVVAALLSGAAARRLRGEPRAEQRDPRVLLLGIVWNLRQVLVPAA